MCSFKPGLEYPLSASSLMPHCPNYSADPVAFREGVGVGVLRNMDEICIRVLFKQGEATGCYHEDKPGASYPGPQRQAQILR